MNADEINKTKRDTIRFGSRTRFRLGIFLWRKRSCQNPKSLFIVVRPDRQYRRAASGKKELYGVANRITSEVRMPQSNLLSTVKQDLTFAARTLVKNPGFTVAVAVSVALAIAANSTVFGIVNGLLLGALPVREPSRLVSLNQGTSFSYPDYTDYRDQTSQVFDGLTAHFPLIPANLGGAGEPERIWGQVAAGNYFSVVGIKPAIGRGFTPLEDRAAGGNPVVVLGDGLWRRRFAAAADAVGRQVVLNGQSYTIIGVMPPGFHGTDRALLADFWVPLAMSGQIMPDLAKDNVNADRNSHWLMLDGRLKLGVSREQAAAQLNVVQRRLDNAYRKNQKPRDPISLTASGGLAGGLDRFAISFMAMLAVLVAMVLLIACANVANLMLARAMGRQREIGLRLALGASRRRLIRQLLTESVLLSLIGAVGGFVLAAAATLAISQFTLPLPLPIKFDFAPDGRVLWFTAALAVVTGIVFGLAPALRATRPDLVTALKDQTTAFGSFRRLGMRNLLVVVQVSLSLVLLAGAGLFLRSLEKASSIDIGMRPDHVLLMATNPKLSQYSPEKTRQYLAQLRERVSALPGVRSVSYLDSVPLSMGGTSLDFKADGVKDAKQITADVYSAGSHFFETMGLPLLHGRDFDKQTDAGSIILNERMAQRVFPNADPIGRRIAEGGKTYEVIGIARNFKSRTLSEAPSDAAFLYLEARPEEVFSFYGISIVVKTTGDPNAMIRPVRRQIAALDPNLAVSGTETMDEHVDKALLMPRLIAVLLGVFGAVGLTLATVGLYGVMSYSVRRRTREIGIRMALGARAGGVLRLVARQGLALAGIGVAIGLALALMLSRFAASLLYGIGATDPLTFVVVPALLLAVAVLAVLLPARRAARTDPLTALRYE
jgi:predicted permease